MHALACIQAHTQLARKIVYFNSHFFFYESLMMRIMSPLYRTHNLSFAEKTQTTVLHNCRYLRLEALASHLLIRPASV